VKIDAMHYKEFWLHTHQNTGYRLGRLVCR